MSMCHDEMRNYYGNRYISGNRGEMPTSRRYSWKETQETLSSDVRLTLETPLLLSFHITNLTLFNFCYNICFSLPDRRGSTVSLKSYCDENHIFPIEPILKHKQVACMTRKMLFTIFKYIFSFQRYLSF